MIKDKTITLINLIGLSLGIACAIILTSWVLYETSYDKQVPDGERIYRATLEGYFNNEFVRSSKVLAGIAPEMKKECPDVETYTRIINHYKDCIIKSDEQAIFKESGYATDSTFFDVFPQKAILGKLSSALNRRDQIVIDQYLSDKCFGDKNPIGKALWVDEHKYTVTAVIATPSTHSHLRFHFLVPLTNIDWLSRNLWGGDNTITFLKFKHPINEDEIGTKMTEIVFSNDPFWKDFQVRFGVQPLHDVYLSDYRFSYGVEAGSKKNIFIFSITAFLVLLIACINFTNLFIASNLKRKRSMGIRLIYGAHKTHLARETIIEVLLFLLSSFIIAMIMVKIIEPFFISLAGKDITIKIFSFRFLMLSMPILVISLALTSIFPSLHFKGVSLANSIKDGKQNSNDKIGIQKILVSAQFVIAIVLICNVLTVNKQLTFLQDKQLGFNTENVIYIPINDQLQQKHIQNRMRKELLQNSNIQEMAIRSSLPTVWSNGKPLANNAAFKDIISAEEIVVDAHYFDLMDINFMEGENIFEHGKTTKNACIINQMAAEAS